MQMKAEKKTKKFDRNKVKKLLEDENEFIVDLLTTLDIPDSIEGKGACGDVDTYSVIVK